ncbi:BZ3500_MvSof-1268-A1-R1_Chr2-1g04263 [Microbotryum saponariae]|uniref:BZ3500_MvSof-1268-A1-R1_Chr2-1g04263 protein n=1 Tax=Microbotryum saponariae TaxID=289078 RepID=A0A2X0MAU7_9BASI|nr:BZ3500_MvSof-1268-A1-R1_Chr2-1g04263 [Microbotryum saponariae]SCZ91257.1 BZ3501_MvSof-1269-A2-R1_Chr2-1g03919 [Microbotryum saponariae]
MFIIYLQRENGGPERVGTLARTRDATEVGSLFLMGVRPDRRVIGESERVVELGASLPAHPFFFRYEFLVPPYWYKRWVARGT